MLIKILMLGLIGWLLVKAIVGYQRSLDKNLRNSEKVSAQAMVQCAACGTYVAQAESHQANGAHYCCVEHIPK